MLNILVSELIICTIKYVVLEKIYKNKIRGNDRFEKVKKIQSEAFIKELKLKL